MALILLTMTSLSLPACKAGHNFLQVSNFSTYNLPKLRSCGGLNHSIHNWWAI